MDIRTHRRGFLLGSVAALAPPRFSTAAPRAHGASGLRAQERGADWRAVEQALGATGQLMEGDVFRVSMPRSDLRVTVQGVPITPAFALGSYAAFRQVGPTAGDTMVMGDLVLLDAEVNPVLSGLFAAGFDVIALHNHLNEMAPHVMYLHYRGHGVARELAEGLRQALAASATPLGGTTTASSAGGEVPAGTTGTPEPMATPTTELPTAQLEEILGRRGRVAGGGVFSVSVPRAETITEGELELVPALGVATVLNFQPIAGGRAAITGDFVMVAEEVNPVARALREHGIEVHALHNHTLTDEPRLFYMHFFATGDPAELARGLRAALDRTNSAKP